MGRTDGHIRVGMIDGGQQRVCRPWVAQVAEAVDATKGDRGVGVGQEVEQRRQSSTVSEPGERARRDEVPRRRPASQHVRRFRQVHHLERIDPGQVQVGIIEQRLDQVGGGG